MRAEDRLAARPEAAGAIRVREMIGVLRDHGGQDDHRDWSPDRTVGRTICMHAGAGHRRSQTVGSIVSDLRQDGSVHWVTASAAPCLSLFKPVVLGAGRPWRQGPVSLGGRYHPLARWWGGEPWRRAALNAYPRVLDAIAAERDRLEASFGERIATARRSGDFAALGRAARTCWREADAAERRWRAQAAPPTKGGRPDPAFRRSWTVAARQAALPVSANNV